VAVLVSVVGLIVSLAWVKQWSASRGTYEVQASFKDVGGLGVGDPVSVRGVDKGSVRRVELKPSGEVEVVLRLDEDAILHDDAVAVIRSVGLMGERCIAVEPGLSGKKVVHGGRIRGMLEPGMSEFMAQASGALEDVRTAAARINEILASGMIEHVVSSIDQTAGEMNSIAQENRDDLRQAITSFRSSADRLKRLVDVHSAGVDTTLALAQNTAQQAEQLASRLERITARIESGDGTLGKLMADETLYDDLRRTVASADSLVKDIKAHPRRYLKFSVF
jgi:phospholipid/cholesterol/gamma-HCH transport system substrate-binding protein